MRKCIKCVSFLWIRDRRFVLFGLTADATSWRGIGLLAALFFGSLAFAVAFMPFTYWVLEWGATQLNSRFAQSLLRNDANKFFDFLRWVSILAGLPWIIWACHLWSFRQLGLVHDGHIRSTWGLGFAAGAVLVAVVAAAQMTFGATVVQPRAELSVLQVSQWTATSLSIAVVVGAIEETIFRGLILRLFYTSTLYPWLALALSAVFFGYTHFKIPASQWGKVGSAHWDTGLLAAYWTLIGFTVEFEFKRFLALWLLGMVLGALMLRTGSLWPGIGLHSGLVFGLLLYHDFAKDSASTRDFWGGTTLTDGWAVVLALSLLFLVVAVNTSLQSPWENSATGPENFVAPKRTRKS
jgi:membrane protease YdiL (CAAX protease family)